MDKKLQLLIGADPEFALVDKKNARYVSAHNLVPGTKDAPAPCNKGAIQADGCMVEFNIDPAPSPWHFSRNIRAVLREIRAIVPKTHSFAFDPVVHFDRYYFDTKVPDDPKMLGCTPDYNAFKKGEMNPTPTPPRGRETMRTCSGHLHIGWTTGADIHNPDHLWDCNQLIKALDTFILPFSYLWDTDTERASLYGKPGAYRPKPYGAEWRTPSNAWLRHPKVWPWLFEAVTWVFNNMDTSIKKDYSISSVTGRPKDMSPEGLLEFYNTTLRRWYSKYPTFPKFDPMWVLPKGTEVKKVEEKEKVLYSVNGKPVFTKVNGIVVGAKVAYTSGKVSFDLDLDHVPPPDMSLTYINPNAFIK